MRQENCVSENLCLKVMVKENFPAGHRQADLVIILLSKTQLKGAPNAT